MKKIFTLFFIVISNYCFSQTGFDNWDKTYKYRSAEKIIQDEIAYSKEVEKDTIKGHYYLAMDKFRFLARFTGKERQIEAKTLNSMRRVFKIKTGTSKVLNGLVSKEFEFDIGNSKIWMPIQNQLMDAFKKEVNNKEKVLLYTLFMNEHQYEGGIINTFLISEFTTEWK